MSKAKELYYSHKEYAEKNLGLYTDDITEYVKELEKQNKELIFTIKDLISICKIHTKHTGTNFAWAEIEAANELLEELT